MDTLNVREIRKRLSLTQQELADRLGVSRNTVINYERGETIPDSKRPLLGRLLETEIPSKEGNYIVSEKKKTGVPYYDVDFIGGFDLVLNDQTRNPTYYIDFPAYNKADAWANITGHSMEPLISHGDIIALKKIEDWPNYILYGEVYGIITSEYRTVKKVRKSIKGEDYLRLVPLNPDYDEQDIHRSLVIGVFQIIGCAKRIF